MAEIVKMIKIINRIARRKTVRMAVRFPVSLLLMAVLAVKLFVDGDQNYYGYFDNDLPNALYIFLFSGVFISLAAALWLEDHFRGWKLYGGVAAVTLLWGAYCYFRMPQMTENVFMEEWASELFGALILHDSNIFSMFFRFALLESMVVATGAALLVFIPFWGKGREKDAAFGNFFSRLCFHFSIGYLISIALKIMLSYILSIHIVHAYHGLWGLFLDVNDTSPVFVVASIFCYVLFLPLWIMTYIPDKNAKHDSKPARNRFPKAVGLFLTSIAAVYAVILYVVFGVWLFSDEPLVYVAVPVSIFAALGLLIIMLRYPSRLRGECLCENSKCAYWLPPADESRAVARMSRWFGVAVLPLLVLMSAAIVMRVSEYGITIMRGYLIILNLWFYGIYAYLFISKARSVKWIPISLGILLILSSAGPWSVSNVTKQILIEEVVHVMEPELFVDGSDAYNMLYEVLSVDAQHADHLLLSHISDEGSRLKAGDKINYLFHAYTWKIKYEGDDVIESYAIGDFTVSPTGKRKSVAIVGYAGSDTILAIPSKLNGQTVAKIGKDAFAGKGIVSVTIPRSVTAIGDRAFMHNKLTGVTIPPRVHTVGAEAFLANELAAVSIPRSVNAIGERAFAHNELSGIKIPRGIKLVSPTAFEGN